ncbi:MAG: glycosyltransferase family 4 protein [Oscillospiraceae bacterium]|nr:glycosyltransferase family 4 protein [Oscillospiraceae bacterium]
MNLLLIDHYAGSEKMGMEYRPYYLAKEWLALGHQVTVAAADFTHLRRENPQTRAAMEWRTIEEVPFLLIQTPAYEENDRHRAANIWRFIRALYRSAAEIAEKVRPQAVIAASTYPLDIYAAGRIAKIAGAKLVFEVHDIHPESMEEIYGYTGRHPLMRALRRAQVFAYKRADLVTSVLPGVGKHMEEAGIPAGKFLWTPNGIPLPRAEEVQTALPPRRHIEFLERYREKGYFLVLYAGGFAAANALDELVEAAGMTGRNVIFAMVGNGIHKPQLKRWARQNNLSNVLFLDAVEHGQLQDILAQADCLYLGAKPLKVYRYGIGMNKIFDYMYAQKPVICAMEAPENPIQLAGCGIVVKPGRPQEIAKAIGALRGLEPEEREAMGRRGREYVLAHHIYPVLAREYAAALERIVEGQMPQDG